jgi:hypothetical protein
MGTISRLGTVGSQHEQQMSQVRRTPRESSQNRSRKNRVFIDTCLQKVPFSIADATPLVVFGVHAVLLEIYDLCQMRDNEGLSHEEAGPFGPSLQASTELNSADVVCTTQSLCVLPDAIP